jgi:hypothetical protein
LAKYRRFKPGGTTLKELSGVDRPAQEGAVAVIMKRADDVAKATKTEDGKAYPASDFAYVPDPAAPSTWKLRLTSTPGGDPDARIVGAALAALGPGGFRGQRVQIPSGDLAGVKSKVRSAWLKANPGKTRDDLPAVIKAETTQEKEMAKENETVTEKKVETQDESPVVYTSETGAVFRKSDDPRLIELAKAADVANKARREADERVRSIELAKRADETISHLPGTTDDKVALLKALDSVADEAQRTRIMESLVAADSAMSSAFTAVGRSIGSEPGSVTEKLNALAQKRADEKSISFGKAYREVLNTEEGRALYAEHRGN